MTGPGARLVLAIGAAAAVVVSAPFIGRLREALRVAFPGQYRAVIVAVVAVAIGGAIAAAAARIRERRRLRFGALAAAVVLGVSFARLISTGNPDIDAVERFHFVEYGLVALLFYRAWRPRGAVTAFALPFCAALTVAFADEWLQWFVPTRYGDLRDVMLNAVAIACGLLFGFAVEPPPRRAGAARPDRALPVAASVALVAGALFVDSVHLGHDIVDADAGRFRSRYRAPALADRAADRAQRWREAPPVVRQGIAREDQYLAEGLWHEKRRNEAVTAGDMRTAWHEDLILEAFYGPVLDLGSRWSPDDRARLGELMAGDTAAYVSDAEPYPIYTVPRAIFWSAAMLTLAAIWVVSRGRALAALDVAPV